MLNTLPTPHPDPLWRIAEAARADGRPGVLDLIVGVFQDDTGRTPTMAAVREAERRLAARDDGKAYRGLSGNRRFTDLVADLVLGPAGSRATGVQTVAGTGALRLLAELVARMPGTGRLWFSDPGYVNHGPIARAAGLESARYRYLDPAGRVDADAMFADLDAARPGDVVLVQGCCHNPSGADLAPAHWERLARLCADRGLLPLVDLAYQGLGRGIEQDAAGTRVLAEAVPELLVATSGSKNFGLYRERVGAALVLGGRPDAVRGELEAIARASYSQPPDHGAAVVVEVLDDPALRAVWSGELDGMRDALQRNRAALAAAFTAAGIGGIVDLEAGAGMFALLPLDAAQIVALRERHAVYVGSDGRVNLAAVTPARASTVAAAVADVLG